MIDVGTTDRSRPAAVRISAAAVTIVISGFTLVGTLFGFAGGYRLATVGMDQLTTWHAEDQRHFNELSNTITTDRETLSSRLTSLENETRNTARDMAEARADLKALTAGTKK